ncbi:dTDP-4-dehydrorhamnose 3,5-epimerase family protein [Streptomonospora litoralis]|uniref:dTDP-4-dehydrorhamnose 3-epimerase n=1 Tax=Streptomonospora litoralis TaxID=2498135 RepID=A0A4P6Q2K9_9ACTN|nr:dTDP-4-dehydrorhamnose 3,5-epimerase family protein [Streptomonospora litoralis]QBI54878.1 dTDP-4-dehydrorhamnose 3-epimerase [Streptomonospora litoralis]
MSFRVLDVEGAVEFGFPEFPDDRGAFASALTESGFAQALGHPPFPLRQASFTRSRRGVIRGVHFTATPPGCAKFVYCPAGRALDLVVDLRVGSPTWGRWDAVELGTAEPKAVYLPVGVGHGVVALEDETVICYLLSAEYVPANELSVSVASPEFADLPIPAEITPVQSARDQAAPLLAEALSAGLLPDYSRCLGVAKEFARG